MSEETTDSWNPADVLSVSDTRSPKGARRVALVMKSGTKLIFVGPAADEAAKFLEDFQTANQPLERIASSLERIAWAIEMFNERESYK